MIKFLYLQECNIEQASTKYVRTRNMSLLKIHKSIKREKENNIRYYMVMNNRKTQE